MGCCNHISPFTAQGNGGVWLALVCEIWSESWEENHAIQRQTKVVFKWSKRIHQSGIWIIHQPEELSYFGRLESQSIHHHNEGTPTWGHQSVIVSTKCQLIPKSSSIIIIIIIIIMIIIIIIIIIIDPTPHRFMPIFEIVNQPNMA